MILAPPIFPNNLSSECTDFLLRCFQRDPESRPSAPQLLNHPFIISNYLRI